MAKEKNFPFSHNLPVPFEEGRKTRDGDDEDIGRAARPLRGQLLANHGTNERISHLVLANIEIENDFDSR